MNETICEECHTDTGATLIESDSGTWLCSDCYGARVGYVNVQLCHDCASRDPNNLYGFDLSPNYGEDEQRRAYGVSDFSSMPCAMCDTHLAGARYTFALWNNNTPAKW